MEKFEHINMDGRLKEIEARYLLEPKLNYASLRVMEDVGYLLRALGECTRVLAFYANEDNYDEGRQFERDVSIVQNDSGFRATQALLAFVKED